MFLLLYIDQKQIEGFKMFLYFSLFYTAKKKVNIFKFHQVLVGLLRLPE